MSEPIVSDNYIRKATICHVVDGDTADAIIDLGFGVKVKQRIRFELVDTPERGQAGYHEAKDFVTDLILNKDVMIQTYKHKSGGFGRYLGHIYVPQEDGSFMNLSEHLIDKGLGVVYQK